MTLQVVQIFHIVWFFVLIIQIL